MRRIILSIFGLLVLSILVGCLGQPEVILAPTQASYPTNLPAATSTSNQIPKLSGDWTITLTQSGGIMGISRSLEVRSDGNMVLTDLLSKKTTPGSLPQDKLKALIDLVSSLKYQPILQPSGCADCYIYTLEISSGAGNFLANSNQIDLPKTGLQPLVDTLSGLLNGLEK